jgi:glycosyltransferase involved in cell wall biosynthesis
MRVLLLHDHAAPFGGSEVMHATLAEGLRARGHAVRTFGSRAGGGTDADVLTFGTTGRSRGLLQLANPPAAIALRRELADHPPDVVHASSYLTQLSPAILPALRRVPTVLRAEWHRNVCATGLRMLPSGVRCSDRWGRACITNRCLAAQDVVPVLGGLALADRWRGVFDAVHACSADVARELVAAGWTQPVTVLHPGAEERPMVTGHAPEAPLVAYAGRLVPEKGAGLLLEAFAAVAEVHREARLLIMGDGPERRTLQRRAAELGIGSRVELPGHLPRPEVERRLEGAAVQVVPSQWPEPFGIVAAEALMRGTPLIASATGGLQEIVVPGETGLLVPVGDRQALGTAVADVLSNPDAARRRAAAGHRDACARLSRRRWLESVIELLSGAAARRSGPASAPAGQTHRRAHLPTRRRR